MVTLRLFSLTNTEVLAGRLRARAIRPAIEAAVQGHSAGALVAVDFSDLQIVTASYFLEALAWLWDREVCPVLVNCEAAIREEVELALKAANLRALFGEISAQGVRNVVPFNLDPIEAETYEKLRRLGTATANDLYNLDRSIQQSAWSNRLALLYRQRLVRKVSVGRQLAYSVFGS